MGWGYPKLIRNSVFIECARGLGIDRLERHFIEKRNRTGAKQPGRTALVGMISEYKDLIKTEPYKFKDFIEEWTGDKMPDGVPDSLTRTLMEYKELMKDSIKYSFHDYVTGRDYEDKDGRVYIPELHSSANPGIFPITHGVARTYFYIWFDQRLFSMELAKYIHRVLKMSPGIDGERDDIRQYMQDVLRWAQWLMLNNFAGESNSSFFESIFHGDQPPAYQVDTKNKKFISQDEVYDPNKMTKKITNSKFSELDYIHQIENEARYFKNIHHLILNDTHEGILNDQGYTVQYFKSALKICKKELKATKDKETKDTLNICITHVKKILKTDSIREIESFYRDSFGNSINYDGDPNLFQFMKHVGIIDSIYGKKIKRGKKNDKK